MKIAIIGANEFQSKLILECKKQNFETHVFAWDNGAIGKNYCDYFYNISITEKELILEHCKKIGIDAVLSIGSDLAIITVNYIAENLNLIGNSINSTLLSTNKYEMRKKLNSVGIPSPKFIKTSNKDISITNLSFPVIVKPTDRSGSRGVTKVYENSSKLSDAIAHSLNESFIKEVIIEEYISGKEYSFEFISQNGFHNFLAITEKFTTGAPNFIERAHFQQPTIDNTILNSAIALCKKALNALNIVNGASHIELKVNNNSIIIIEVGARMGGDFIGSDLVKLSTGYDLTKAVLDISLGKEIFVNKTKQNYSFVYFFFNKNDVLKYKKHYQTFQKFIIEENIDTKYSYSKVSDSSNRHGYVIFQFNSLNDFQLIKEILL